MCDCYWDNPPTFYDCKTVKGRKEHKCSECLRVIEKGESHEYAKGLWDGDFSDFRTCGICCAMRDEIDLKCYCHGMMMEEIDERDYPGVKSVVDFHKRRDSNWHRLDRAKRQLANT
jgi:hypothetical protein